MKESQLKTLGVLTFLGFVFLGFQNCSQDPYSGSKKQEAASITQETGMKILLVDHLQPSVAPEETVTFTVDFDNTGADSYRWYKQMPFVGDQLLETTNRAQFKIETFQPENAGHYKVVAVRGDTEISSDTIELSVHLTD